jgi:hypothetical protein
MAWLMMSTYVVNSFETYLNDGRFGVENEVQEVSTDGDTFLDQAGSLLSTFQNAVFFNVDGLPAIVSLICFTIPALIFAYMLFDALVELIPF